MIISSIASLLSALSIFYYDGVAKTQVNYSVMTSNESQLVIYVDNYFNYDVANGGCIYLNYGGLGEMSNVIVLNQFNSDYFTYSTNTSLSSGVGDKYNVNLLSECRLYGYDTGDFSNGSYLISSDLVALSGAPITSSKTYDGSTWTYSNYALVVEFTLVPQDVINYYYDLGVKDGVNDFVNSQTYQDALDTSYANGWSNGYSDGLSDGIDTDSTALTITTGIINVGLLPVNVFLKMFNYEIFGVNISSVVSAFLTIAIVLIVIRMITGKKSGSD